MNKIVLAICLLMASLVAILGLYLFLKGARRIQLGVVSANWPKTSGKVISSETTRDAATHMKSTSVTYGTAIKIGYAVNGHDYTTGLLRFGQALGSGDKSDAEVQQLRYPVDKIVPVSYDPSNPAIGVMKPGLHTEAFWLPGAGLAFLLPALLCIFFLPGMFRGLDTGQQEFANYVETSIQQRRTGLRPPLRPGGGKTMPVAAASFGAVFCCLGILALTAGLQHAWHGKASESWPTVPGTVIHTREDEPTDTAQTAARSRLIYQYDVSGATHFNNVRQFAPVEDVARYTTGQHVKVAYFPADPDISVLEPGNAGAALIIPGIGVVLLLFSLGVFFVVVPAVGKF